MWSDLASVADLLASVIAAVAALVCSSKLKTIATSVSYSKAAGNETHIHNYGANFRPGPDADGGATR